MIKKLKIKFISITMIILFVILLIVFLTLNVFMIRNSFNEVNIALESAIRNSESQTKDFLKGNSAKDPHPDPSRLSKIFVVNYDSDHNFTGIDKGQMQYVTDDEIKKYANEALSKGKNFGRIQGYQYIVKPTYYGFDVALADVTVEQDMLNRLAVVSSVIVFACLIIFFVLVMFLAEWAIKPVEIAFLKQKQFVGDASHELKTPLTIISANSDIIENEIGQNRWLASTKEQIRKMDSLIKSLLSLARTENSNVSFERFDISNTVLNTSLEFESLAFEQKKNLILNVIPNITYNGNETYIRQVIQILLDNAIKYSIPDSDIIVNLKIQKKIYLEVINNTPNAGNLDESKIFDRFYRGDSSHSNITEGYGLGLSIAKSIVDLHKGHIKVMIKNNVKVSFVVQL